MKYEDLKKIIESCHLNLLIGSGASKPFLNTLNDIESALDGLHRKVGLNEEQQDENVLKLLNVSIKHYYFKKCIERNIELLEFNDSSNETMDNYIHLLESIQTILVKRSTNIISKQVNLFTTNMDVFFDVTLEKLGYSVNDGFSGRMKPQFGTENFHNLVSKVSSHYEYQSTVPLFNLFKMHGSLNWKLNERSDVICFDGGLNGTKELARIQFNNNELVDCFDEEGKFIGLHEAYLIASKKEVVRELEENLNNFLSVYDKLVMVNPNKDKFEETTLKYSYYELLRMYSNNLERENSVLIVTGFSFADEHICKITTRVAKSNPTLLIVIFAFDDNAESEIKQRLGTTSNVVYVPREGENNLTLKRINEFFFMRLARELISPSMKKSTESSKSKDENEH